MSGNRLSAHLGYLFTDLPLSARPEAARAAGFDAVEHPAPFEIPAATLRRMLDDAGLALAQITSGTGGPGEKGVAALPGREAEFRDSYARALDYAETAGSPFVAVMAGVGGDRATLCANLETAARMCESRHPRLLLEAISAATVPGYAMGRFDDLLALAAEMEGRMSVLIDAFHARAEGHDPAEILRRAGAALGHVHIADFPGRGQPGSGSTDFTALRAALAEIGYRGAIGFEYIPSGPGHLGWLPGWRAAMSSAAGAGQE